MDIFLVLQILFDAVLLFGILFLFHYSVNQQQKRKEDLDIVQNIQVQEMKENLEKLMTTMKQLGKEVSDDIQKKIAESEEKAGMFKENLKKLEGELNMTMELAGEVTAERARLESKVKMMRATSDKKEKLPSDEKVAEKAPRIEKKKKTAPAKTANAYGVGFSTGIVKQVYKLADQNTDINEIAKVTKLSQAEVHLILNLRENRFTTPN